AYYAKGPNGEKQMIAAHNLLNPEGKYSGVSVYEWAPGKYATPVFTVNDPSIEGTRIPSHYIMRSMEAFLSQVMHGNFALGLAISEGDFDPAGLRSNAKLQTVDQKLRLFDTLLAKYEQRLKDGTVFADGAKISLRGPTPPIFLREGLPDYVEYVVEYDETKKPAVYEGMKLIPDEKLSKLVETEYVDGVLRMTISMNEELYRLVASEYVCDMGGFMRLWVDYNSWGGSEDASTMPIMWALGIEPPWNPGIESQRIGGKDFGVINSARFPHVFDKGAGYDCGLAPLK
ncbi:MAG TPA: hypothetical protein PLF42_00365, partial [Anaerolineales bacterium]|nr:hypothetical protein [Anaerolineales bacterium]